MITLQQHIDELQAELRGCFKHRERAAIKAELIAAVTAQRKHDHAIPARHSGQGR
jgi:hypothetical protein